jgi:formylglycine-generating enzyme required for sulfatase activity
MIRIPAGSFIMGVGNNEGYPDARPSHEVILSDFFIDETEVTNALYKLCVDNSVCPEPEFTGSPSRVSYYGAEPFNEYPMIYLSWDEAQEYCQWRGGHLPTEAQWEKAARWDPATNTSRMFPWSHGSLDQFYLNFDSLFGDTRAVKSYPEGASAYGLFDMAGNVKEWVYDWYDPNYYAVSPAEDPPGPDSGQFRVLRGGSYESKGSGVSTTFREYIGPGTKLATVGFRCAFTPSGGPSND